MDNLLNITSNIFIISLTISSMNKDFGSKIISYKNNAELNGRVLINGNLITNVSKMMYRNCMVSNCKPKFDIIDRD